MNLITMILKIYYKFTKFINIKDNELLEVTKESLFARYYKELIAPDNFKRFLGNGGYLTKFFPQSDSSEEGTRQPCHKLDSRSDDR